MFQEHQQIGVYTLLKKLGEGGFGEVWLAERRSELVTKRVAVKLPHDDQIGIEAIKQEATLWEQASGNTNVLPIIDADIYDGQVVIVSEYADGGSLHDKLKKEGKLSPNEAVELTIGILNGLEFLHSRKIIHRDIKPANILFQGKTPRLMDFGISRAMQTSLQSSTIVGTNAYMSPEALDGKYSFQSDIWSVGVVLYQLLTGVLPFPQERPSERMFAILQKDFEPLPNDIPQEIQRIITKSLAKLPENRYQTASLMCEDLQHLLLSISSKDSWTEIPPTEPSPPISNYNSTLTVKKFPNPNIGESFETKKAELFSQTINSEPKKRNYLLYLLMGALIGISVIGGTLGIILSSLGDEKSSIANSNTNANNLVSKSSTPNLNSSTPSNIKPNDIKININNKNVNSGKSTNQSTKKSNSEKTPVKKTTSSPTPITRKDLSTSKESRPPPPKPKPPKPKVPKRISGGVVNGKATSLPKPAYPAAARAANIKGSVNVAIVISKSSVMSARAVSGHPLLRRAAVSAARRARFRPTLLSGQAVEVSGVVVYNFQ